MRKSAWGRHFGVVEMPLSHLNAWASRRPALAAVAAGGAKYIVCDVAVQLTEDTKSLDLQRVGAFATFGSAYAGGAQYFILNRFLPWCLPLLSRGRHSPQAVLLATSFDVFLHMPLLYLPVFYSVREIAYRPGPPGTVMTNAVQEYKKGFWSDASTSLTIFGPVQLLNFGLSPAHLRVPVLLTAGLLWTAILSARHGQRS